LPSDYDSEPAVHARHPLLRFDIIDIPRQGEVTLVAGDVDRLDSENRWVAIRKGDRVSHRDKLMIGPGAILTLAFSAAERAEFSAAPDERWVQFEIAGE
jgi:hypothetical protein